MMAAKRKPSKARLARIRMIIFDFDGVLTDNYVFVGENGERFKRFWVPDGVGVYLGHRADLKFAIITGNSDQSTLHRARHLKIDEVYQTVYDKGEAYADVKRKHKLSDDECLFVGDDLPDRPIFEQVGIGVAPVDAHPEIRRLADWVGRSPSGRGIVREAIDAVLNARNFRWPPADGDDDGSNRRKGRGRKQ
jgi:3-deoxy-D-manno-octulosonate 8-phosphate phosphatase (KDO 8-P phosphatase)